MRVVSVETRRKISDTFKRKGLVPVGAFKKGHVPFTKGKKLSDERKALISQTLKTRGIKPKQRFQAYGIEHPAWKGEFASYSAFHYWVSRHKGKPTKCETCGKDGLTGKRIHWANISGLYLRDLDDYMRMCVPCHKRYDLSRIGQALIFGATKI